jgi:hypothetical protein
MTNTQNIIGLFIVLVVILSMGLQFFDHKEGFSNNSDNNGKKNNKKDNSIPVYSKKNNSMAKQNILNDSVPNY